MPRWFRLAASLSCPALWFLWTYVMPERGFVAGSFMMLLCLAGGVSALIIGRYDRQASHADDMITLKLN
jgi:hypothetical protein